MAQRSKKSNPEIKLETNEAGVFAEEEVHEILDRLASLLISHWEKTHPQQSDNNPKSQQET